MPQHAVRFWVLAFVGLMVVVWALKPMLLPFVAGMVIAYFLDPVVQGIAARKVPRSLGAVVVLAGFVLAVALLLLLVVPVVENQIGALIVALPSYIQNARAHIEPWTDKWLTQLSPDDVDKLREAAGTYAGSAVGWAGKILKDVVSGGFALFDILTLFVITPVVAFYLLRDWPTLTANIDGLLPRQHYDMIRAELQKIDRTLSGFLRGQALVCLSLGLIYGIGLTLVGLKYGATIGIIGGVLSFVPYVGKLVACGASLALAFMQFDSTLSIGLVAGVLVVGHVMEDYVLTPKLVGDRVGLHPVWILFALLAGGSLLGFTGLLIAVPVAAILGVLIRFALQQYKASALYDGKRSA